jgi:replicative DNA helicase
LSQLNRADKKSKNHRPVLGDLRQSGSLEQDSCLVIFVHREHYYTKDDADKGYAEIIVEKQRNGPLQSLKMGWKWECAKFYELEDNKESEGGW